MTHPSKDIILLQKIAELKAALIKAKAEAEVMECKKEDIGRELAGLAESLQSTHIHHQIFRIEEDAMTDRWVKLSQCLKTNAEEWVSLTGSMKFTCRLNVIVNTHVIVGKATQ